MYFDILHKFSCLSYINLVIIPVNFNINKT